MVRGVGASSVIIFVARSEKPYASVQAPVASELRSSVLRTTYELGSSLSDLATRGSPDSS